MPTVLTRLFAHLCRAVLTLAGSQIAAAQEPARLQEQVQLCAACHGENGVPLEKTTPIIWGQTWATNTCNCATTRMATARRPDDTRGRDAGKATCWRWPNTFRKSRGRATPHRRRPEVAEQAARANTAVGCTGCHQGQYQGEGTQPRLAGQNEAYMAKTMLEIRSGERANNPGMTTLMKATSPDDLNALAQYLAGLDIR
jgi:cytochrome c553